MGGEEGEGGHGGDSLMRLFSWFLVLGSWPCCSASDGVSHSLSLAVIDDVDGHRPKEDGGG